ncbi:MAG: hypothetical protein NXI20_13840 [bacterium]|nr:hypothetical protein [bacterium]
MKKILAIRTILPFVLCAMVASFILTSCEEDEPISEETTVLSFGPAGVKHGETIQVIGTNLDKVTSILFKPDVEVTDFANQSSGSIEVVVPQAAEPGVLVFKTPTEEIETKTILNFEVDVTIDGITNSIKPGETITITGDKLNWIETITFPSDLIVLGENFVSQTGSELQVEVPMSAQSGFITFTSGGTEPAVFAFETALDVLTPQISALNPSSVRHESVLTIEGQNLDLVTEVEFYEGVTVAMADFNSHTATAITLTVPATVETGKIILKQLSPVDVESTEDLVIVLPVGTSITPSEQRPGVDEVTIMGTDLDLVASLEIPGHGTLLAADFNAHTANQIVFDLPEMASIGVINYVTIHGYSGSLGLAISIPSTGLGDLLIPVYLDAVDPLMSEGGGWNTTTDFTNTENPREGTSSMKVTYDGSYGGGGQLGTWGKDPVEISGTEVFAFSLYGGSGTDGQQLNINVRSDVDNFILVTIEEGEWVDFQIPLSDLGNPTSITEIWFQDQGWAGTVYIDRMGFDLQRELGPDPLTIIGYDDAVTSIFGEGGGWGGSVTDFSNTETTREGDNAIKVTFAADFGGAAQLGTWGKDNVSIAGTTVFAFSLYGGAGTDGQQLNVNVKLDTDNPQLVTITEGEWVDIEIPLSDFGSFTEVTEIWFQDQGWSGDIYIDYIGFR